MTRIYVASSWRNSIQPLVVSTLREAGHEVYDFKNPEPGNTGFSWSAIDPKWRDWTPQQFRAALQHPIAKRGFGLDHAAMEWADTFVMVLPCGRSAHTEMGWACGAGKRVLILQTGQEEPELMYLEADAICHSIAEVVDLLKPPVDTHLLKPPVDTRHADAIAAYNATPGVIHPCYD